MRINHSLRSLFFGLAMITISVASYAQFGIGISVNFAPPELPVYEQPLCPGEGYIWTPGYWAYGDDDYYWVPGTWVEAPEVGYLWTPPYWGYGDGGAYLFHEGYWGTHIGFYGGISYGFGYFGEGYEGGRWDGDRFFYNRSVNNVNVTNIHNTYNTTINNTTINRVSFNGGNGGVQARATAQQQAVANERHIPPVQAQQQHFQAARSNPELRASANHGRPPVAATARPADFKTNVVPAREGGRVNPRSGNAASGNNAPRPGNTTPSGNNVPRPGNTAASGNNTPRPSHVSELPARERPTPPQSGNPKVDQRYQKQQDKLYAQQDKERQRVQQQQERDHQRLDQKHADDARKQQIEQKHQQQTQQLEQKHQQQQERLQSRQQPRGAQPPKP